jgi:CDP-diacylglycerol--glycerol-3-phosphate 3-phosphatidyltransferase
MAKLGQKVRDVLIRRSDFYLIPNLLTVSRVFAIPLVAAFAYFHWNLSAASVFGLAGISDYIDGWIARRYRYESKLGMLLDPLADKLIIVSSMIMLMWLGRLDLDWVNSKEFDFIAPLLVIVTVGREIAITGLRGIASTIGIVIAAEKGGKLKTWVQFFAIVFLLIDGSPWRNIGQVLLVFSVAAALWSAAQYTIRFVRGLPA